MFLILFWLGATSTIVAIGQDSNWNFDLYNIPLYKKEIIIENKKDKK